nr:hypothetical protein [uncultured Blautia sp.]
MTVKGFKTNGVQLSTNTMANWVSKSTDVYLSLIYDSKVIHADESPIKVMRTDHAKIKNGVFLSDGNVPMDNNYAEQAI